MAGTSQWACELSTIDTALLLAGVAGIEDTGRPIPGQSRRPPDLHLRFNNLTEPEPVPLETDYSNVIKSDVPIVVQHTRLDSRQAANALISSIAYTE